MVTVTIRGEEFEFDTLDFVQFETYERELLKLQSQMEKLKTKKMAKASDYIKTVCTVCFNFFEAVLGDDASNKIFGESVNLRECLDAVGEFAGQVKDQQTNDLSEITSKYLPNRTI